VANLRSETEVVLYVQKQLEQADEVVVVYEAGPLGYGLYRKLTALGAKCLVCAADSSQQQRKRRKNNQIDTRTLTSNLFNHCNGNEAALQLVRVPTPEQEQARLVSRQHDQLVKERKRLGAEGNSLLLSQGFGSWKNWWRPKWSTGDKQRRGSITKVGVPAIRRIITEMVWRIIQFQPQYPPAQKWQEVLLGTNRTLKKKAVVAIGRQLIVDLWRMQTGRLSAEQLNLIMVGS
jgi:transposase